MDTLYWMNVLGNIRGFAFILLVILIIFYIFMLISVLVTCCETDFNEFPKIHLNILKKTVIPTIIVVMLSIFIPTKKEFLFIYGVGGTFDYIKENPTAQKLPDKFIKVMDNWADIELKNDSTINIKIA